jgi:hypothetical protein
MRLAAKDRRQRAEVGSCSQLWDPTARSSSLRIMEEWNCLKFHRVKRTSANGPKSGKLAEIERLDWSEIDFDREQLIEVTAAKSKTARRRFVKIQPNLRAWLASVRKHSGKVTPENFVTV